MMLHQKRRAISVLLVLTYCLSVLCGCSADSDSKGSPSVTTSTFTMADVGESTLSSSIAETTITTTTSATTTTTTSTKASTNSTTKTTKTTTAHPINTPTSSKQTYSIRGVPVIHQMPDFPTGCESVSAVMVLRYWGETISVNEFIAKHLPKNTKFYWENGKKYGPDPNEYFIGNPHTTQSYGCMAPVIEKALVNYFGSNNRVINTTGTSLKQLCDNYIDKNMPVLIWATIGMIDTKTSDQWLLEDGTLFEWPENEHCMVLIGYDTDYYYFNDPYRGAVKKYAKWLVEKRYQQLGNQSLTITN